MVTNKTRAFASAALESDTLMEHSTKHKKYQDLTSRICNVSKSHELLQLKALQSNPYNNYI